MAFSILISDEQRLALIDVLAAVPSEGPGAPLEYWTSMLRDLPKVEAESPGVLHGFCL
jgi:hypothetical protein